MGAGKRLPQGVEDAEDWDFKTKAGIQETERERGLS